MPSQRLAWWAANGPSRPSMNILPLTMSSNPLRRKINPRENWMPRTTGGVKSRAARSTSRPAQSTNITAPKRMPAAAMTGTVTSAGLAMAMAATALSGCTGTGSP